MTEEKFKEIEKLREEIRNLKGERRRLEESVIDLSEGPGLRYIIKNQNSFRNELLDFVRSKYCGNVEELEKRFNEI